MGAESEAYSLDKIMDVESFVQNLISQSLPSTEWLAGNCDCGIFHSVEMEFAVDLLLQMWCRLVMGVYQEPCLEDRVGIILPISYGGSA